MHMALSPLSSIQIIIVHRSMFLCQNEKPGKMRMTSVRWNRFTVCVFVGTNTREQVRVIKVARTCTRLVRVYW